MEEKKRWRRAKMSILDEFRRFMESKIHIPVKGHEVVRAFERPPVIALGLENLYGIPIHDLLEGFKGQILGVDIIANYTDRRHPMPVMGLRLRLGSSMLFARAQPKTRKEASAYSYPIVVNGVVTPYIELLKRPELKFYFYEYRSDVIGEFEVAMDDVVNLEQVMSGSAPVMLTDKHGVRYIERLKEADKLLELSHLAETLTRELQKYQIKAEEERRNARMAASMTEFYRRLVEDARDRVEKLSKEYYNIREEFERVVEQLKVKMAQLDITSFSEKTFQVMAEKYLSQFEPLVNRLSSAVEALKNLSEELTTMPVKYVAEEEKGGGAGGG